MNDKKKNKKALQWSAALLVTFNIVIMTETHLEFIGVPVLLVSVPTGVNQRKVHGKD